MSDQWEDIKREQMTNPFTAADKRIADAARQYWLARKTGIGRADAKHKLYELLMKDYAETNHEDTHDD